MSQEWKLVPHALNSDIEQIIGFIADGVYDDEETAWAMLLAAAPVPPADGKVEVLAFLDAQGDVMNSEIGAVFAAVYPGYTDLVDRAHVTRLQAENATLQQRLTIADQRVDDLETEPKRSQ